MTKILHRSHSCVPDGYINNPDDYTNQSKKEGRLTINRERLFNDNQTVYNPNNNSGSGIRNRTASLGRRPQQRCRKQSIVGTKNHSLSIPNFNKRRGGSSSKMSDTSCSEVVDMAGVLEEESVVDLNTPLIWQQFVYHILSIRGDNFNFGINMFAERVKPSHNYNQALREEMLLEKQGK